MNCFSSFLFLFYISIVLVGFFEKALEMYTKMVYINLVKNSIRSAEAILLNFKMKKVETWTD
jgi:hypothetical protein